MSENSQTVHFLAQLRNKGFWYPITVSQCTKKSEGDINAYKGFRAYDETMQNCYCKMQAIAAKKLKCHAEFERVNDLRRVVAYGVMALPALVIDEKVVAGGSVLPVEEIMEIIRHLN